jgi:hypothetical protein
MAKLLSERRRSGRLATGKASALTAGMWHVAEPRISQHCWSLEAV